MTRKTWRMTFLMGCVFILIFGVCGCADLFSYRTVGAREPEVKRPVQTSHQFEDVPIPSGMNFNRKESFIYETKATKTGLLVYEGRGEMEKLVRFFKREMPNYQWRLVSSFELNNVMLIFMKEGWCSVISIVPYPQDEEAKRLEIRVGPIGLKLPS